MFKKLFLFIFVTAIGLGAFLYFTRSALYNYDVAADYAYDFSDKQATITVLSIAGGTLSLPKKEDMNRSSFLEISVRSTPQSKILRPSVTISDGTSTEVEFYEHGAAGKRYVNVSKFVEKGATDLRLIGKYLSVDNGSVQLIQFDNIEFEGKRVLVMAGHPDDAEISSFGLYSGHDDVYVVTVTSGDAGPFMYDEIYTDPVAHYLKKGEVRTWNSLTVPMLGGVHPENILNLGYNDARLKSMEADKSLVASGRYTEISDMNTFRKQNSSSLAVGLVGINNWESLVGNMVYLLNEIKPDIIITPSPKLDMHSDHQYTTHALVEALKQIDRHDGHLLLYTNHQVVFNERYPYGDAGALTSLPPTPRGANHFGRLYSHPMSVEQQNSKILALDAMNDLRLGTDFRYPLRAFKQAFETLWSNLDGSNEQYFRRAIRSNEFFYVVDIEDIYDDEKLGDL
ncbi:MAG: PIG-L family deacetylase [Kordiimonadaceae bacterium]|nr:PIG-L family deacetylase [Kordiimonadaceae bacterium]MBT6036204.1 PIG-L family deacetylase [Kordiimonadaceae bacterium]MBT6329760.1 PIG-L family deacetylase [Kordiimonadaceae bacterium]